MTRLRDMNQEEVISWVQSLGLSESHKRQIIDGIQLYAQQVGDEVTGRDLYDADLDDIQEITRKRVIAKRLFKEIQQKKQQDEFEAAVTSLARRDSNIRFTLNIQSMGRMIGIRDATKSWTISEVKSRCMEEMGRNVNLNVFALIRYRGKRMQDNRTLQDYGIVNGRHLPLVLTFKAMGGGGPVDDEKRDINTRIKEEIQVIASKPDAPRAKVYELAKKTYRREGKPVIIDTKNTLTDVKQNARNYRNVALPMTLAMDKDFSTWNEQQFKCDFANKFNVPIECIKVVSVKAGSIIADVELHTHWKDKDGNHKSMGIQVIADKVDPVVAKKAFAEFAVFAVEFKPPKSGFDCTQRQVIMNPKWNKTYGQGAHNWDGPCKDGKSRGGEPYYCPKGWKRFSIQFSESAYDFANVYDKWPIAYHGTKFDFSIMITLSGLKCFGGAYGCGVYMSPSINYVAHDRYAKAVKLDFSKYENIQKQWSSDHAAEFRKYDGKWIQCAFALRVKPGSYTKNRDTMGLKQDPYDGIKRDEIIWCVNGAHEEIITDDKILIYGIMIKVSDTKPSGHVYN